MGKRQTHAGLQTSQGVTSAHEAQLDELRISNPLVAEFESRRGYSLHFKLPFITFDNDTELWCNGNTSDFDSGILGSNPGSSTNRYWGNW